MEYINVKRLAEISDIAKAIILYSEDENYTETLLQLDDESMDEAHEIIYDYGGGFTIGSEDHFIIIDKCAYCFNPDNVKATAAADPALFNY